MHSLWLHFEFLSNCIAWRLHTALNLLRDSKTISSPSLKWTCPEVRVSAALRSPITIQTSALWTWDIPSRFRCCRRSWQSWAISGCLSALQHTNSAVLCECRCAMQYYGCKHGCADAHKVAFHLFEQVPKTTPIWRRICLNIQDQCCCSCFAFDIWALR